MKFKILIPLVSLLAFLNPNLSQAQVVEDTTLSTEVIEESDGNYRVGVGEQRGNNLFHSFEQFSLANKGSVLFDNALTIENIISRVTGNSVSNINGSILNNGTANLFLINPNGIVFGENATLNIGGSFVGTTASSLLFEDGVEFSANPERTESLLTVSTPLGLQFGSSSGEIVNRASFSTVNPLEPSGVSQNKLGLVSAPDKTFALFGTGITFDGGAVTVPSGNVELGSVAENSLIILKPDSEGWKANYGRVSQFRDIKLDNLASLDTSGESGGGIELTARNIEILGGSAITSNTLGNSDGKDINIQAVNLVTIGGSDTTGTKIDPLLAGLEIFLPFSSQISSNTSGAGNGGDINLIANNVQLTDGGAIELQTLQTATGNGGSLSITVEESIDLRGFRPLLGIGENAANLILPGIDLDTAIDLNQGSEISTATINSARSGDINIVAQDLRLEDGAVIGVSPFASGSGGNINLTLNQSLKITGVSLRTGGFGSIITANTFADGNAGTINITTKQLQIKDGGLLASSSATAGNSGDINVNADSIEISGVSDLTQTPSLIATEIGEGGEGGDIILNTDNLKIGNRAGISVTGSDFGIPGNLIINANSVELENSASITAETEFQAGGNIELNITDRLTLRDNSLISAQAFNDARGGNLSIDAEFIIAFPQENNDILANALFGSGGNIALDTIGIFGLEERNSLPPNATNDLDASSEFGTAGIVSISFPNISKVGGQLEVPTDKLDVDSLFQNTFCKVQGKSRFVATGRSGIPQVPDNTLLPEHTWSDWRMIETEEREVEVPEETPEIAPKKLTIIQGWVTDEDGNVILTDRPLTVAARKPGLNTPDCNQLR